jgi:nucleoside-diphosphate-sugar epimerase
MTEFETATLRQRAPLDSTRAEQVFGYRSQFPLREGIKAYADLYAAWKARETPLQGR